MLVVHRYSYMLTCLQRHSYHSYMFTEGSLTKTVNEYH